MKDASLVTSGSNTNPFKDHLSHVNTHRTIGHTETPSHTSNSVSLTTLACKNSSGYLKTASTHFKELAASQANIIEGSAAFPLTKGSCRGSALWLLVGTHCHCEADCGVLVASMGSFLGHAVREFSPPRSAQPIVITLLLMAKLTTHLHSFLPLPTLLTSS